MEPAEPITGDAYNLQLPAFHPTGPRPSRPLQAVGWMAKIFSPTLQRMLVDCKRQELEIFAQHVTDFEYHTYLEPM